MFLLENAFVLFQKMTEKKYCLNLQFLNSSNVFRMPVYGGSGPFLPPVANKKALPVLVAVNPPSPTRADSLYSGAESDDENAETVFGMEDTR